MAIYKLKDICDLKKGKGKFYKRHLNQNSDIIAYHYGQLYKTDLLTEWKTTVNQEFSRDDNYVNVDEIMIIDVSESFDEIGHVIYNNFEKGLIGNHIIHLYNFRNTLPKWLFYYLKNNQILFKNLSYGDKVASLKIADIRHLNIKNIPSLKKQQEIIDIIKPIEEQIIVISKIINNMENLFNLNITDNNISMFCDKYNSGYAYKKNEKDNQGKYNIFTIKNISGSKNFDRTNIKHKNLLEIGNVITGLSGTIGTATQCITHNLVSNQRTLSLSTPYPVQVSLAIEKQSEMLKRKSTGAVQKNITKNDILELKFEPMFEKEYDDIIINLKIQKNKLLDIKSNIIKKFIK